MCHSFSYLIDGPLLFVDIFKTNVVWVTQGQVEILHTIDLGGKLPNGKFIGQRTQEEMETSDIGGADEEM